MIRRVHVHAHVPQVQLAGEGLPVLDGLGPVGGLDHSPREYITLSSIVPRTALLALLLLRWAEA